MAKKSHLDARQVPIEMSDKYALTLASLCTLAITPFISFDPINPIKLVLLAVAAGFFFDRLSRPRELLDQLGMIVSFCLIGIVLWGTISIVVSDRYWPEELYGTYGRNTGLLAYTSFVLIIAGLASSKTRNLPLHANRAFFFTAVPFVGYGILQFFGLDLVDWSNQYNRILGTLGNPNFSSAFFGMVSVAGIPYIFDKSLKSQSRIFFGGLSVLSLLLTLGAKSWQGSVIVVAGVCIFTIYHFFTTNKRSLAWLSCAAGISLIVVSIMGFRGIGILGSILERNTFSIRIEYWRTAWHSISNNLMFGNGFDSLVDTFRVYRDSQTLALIGPNVTTNSAHNVYLDLGIGAGLPAMIMMVTVKFILTIRIGRRLIAGEKFSRYQVSLSLAWIGYELQSLISINQLGLGVWGAVLCGLLLREFSPATNLNKHPRGKSTNELRTLLSASGAALMLFVAMPPFVADANFVSALERGDTGQLINYSKSFPIDRERLRFTIAQLERAGLDEDAYALSDRAVKMFPNDYNLWGIRATIKLATDSDREEARRNLVRIDPLRKI